VTRRRARGFTLLELMLALGIAGALLVILFGGLRVGLAAWSTGDARTARLDHARNVALLFERALAGTFPYRFALDDGEEARVLFAGQPDRLVFVTLTPPLPATATDAFTAVSLAGGADGLTLRQQLMPNRLALDRVEPALVDPETSSVRFRYLGREPGAWQTQWDMTQEETLPRAVEITLSTRQGRGVVTEALIVPIRAVEP
jgi:general secretion pathway protein J